MLVTTVLIPPARSMFELAAQVLCRAITHSSGRTALDCVGVPSALAHPPSARTLRLIRQARVSAW